MLRKARSIPFMLNTKQSLMLLSDAKVNGGQITPSTAHTALIYWLSGDSNTTLTLVGSQMYDFQINECHQVFMIKILPGIDVFMLQDHKL